MASILFVTWDGGGNVPPAAGIAEELGRRGHAVRFLGHEQQRAGLEGAGFAFTAYRHARPWSATEPMSGLREAREYLALFTDPGPGRDLLDAVGREPADLVVVDCMSLGALQAAERAGLRRVVLAHTFHRYLTHRWARGPIGLVARLRGRGPLGLWDRADVVLVASERELDPARDMPANVRHTGVVQAAPGAARGGGPQVLVSLSTIHFGGQEEALQSILDALGSTPLTAAVTTGPAVDPGRLRAPADVELHRHVPHGELMPDASLVIGHGGHSTTMRALAHDLPVIVMPMHPMLDQAMIGRAVQDAGAGTVLAKDAGPDRIRAAVLEFAGPGAHRDAAARLGARIRGRDGAAAAADHVEALVGCARQTPRRPTM